MMNVERFSTKCHKNKSTMASVTGTNHNYIKINMTDALRGKTCVTKSRLVVILHLIGRVSGASFKPITERGKAKPKQFAITFDTQLKTAVALKQLSS